MSKHGRSAVTKEHVCPVCSDAMNRSQSLRDKYNASILKGTGDGEPVESKRVRR